jgi:hypothetical protein
MPRRGKMFIEKMTPQKRSAVSTKYHVAPLVLNVLGIWHCYKHSVSLGQIHKNKKPECTGNSGPTRHDVLKGG